MPVALGSQVLFFGLLCWMLWQQRPNPLVEGEGLGQASVAVHPTLIQVVKTRDSASESLGVSKSLDSLAREYKASVESLKAEVRAVEKVNDARFETFGWTLGLLFAAFGVSLTINILNSTAAARDKVNEALEKAQGDLQALEATYNKIKGKADNLAELLTPNDKKDGDDSTK